VGVCRTVLKILTKFQTKKKTLSTPGSDLASKMFIPFWELRKYRRFMSIKQQRSLSTCGYHARVIYEGDFGGAWVGTALIQKKYS